MSTITDPLGTLRSEAQSAYERLPFPTGREEHWRYTDVSKLKLDGYTPSDTDRKLTAPESVTYASLEDAPELLGTLVGADDVFRAWSLANGTGRVIRVPAGKRVEQPIEEIFSVREGISAPRTVIIVEDGAEVVFNQKWEGSAEAMVLPGVELFIGKGARVGWLSWQDCGPGVKYIANMKARLDRDAFLQTIVVTTGADYSRTWKECELAGEHSESEMLGLYFPRGEQRFEHWTVQDHVAAHTKSDLLYKGALTDHSRAVYYGTIRVGENAVKTDAYQANRNLTLSRTARADTNPQLEILTNDVRCTHGATVGQVDEEQMFYFQTRGLDRVEAQKLIVFGFFNEVVDRVAWSGEQERLAEAIHERVQS